MLLTVRFLKCFSCFHFLMTLLLLFIPFVIFYIYNLDPIVYIVKTNCAFELFLKEIVFYLYVTKGTYCEHCS